MSEQDRSIKTNHSFHTTNSTQSRSPFRWKSEGNFSQTSDIRTLNVERDPCKEYYKKYEHDELPVKDENSFNDHSFSEANDSRTSANKDSVTNSDLDKLEIDTLRKMSQEIQSNNTSNVSLESNIKLLREFIENMLNNYHQNMKDIDECKKKFNEILERNKGDSAEDMANFIIEMLRHMSSSECNIIQDKLKQPPTKYGPATDIHETLQSFRNDNYKTNSSTDDVCSKDKTSSTRDSFNIFLVSSNPCVEIRMHNRDLLSEINIRDKCVNQLRAEVASADNIKILAAKKLQNEKQALEEEVHRTNDREIPIKNTNAKKDLYLNEDFSKEKGEDDKFFIFKICSYLCKKIRKNPFA